MITVVEYDEKKRKIDEHPVGLRYRALFGDEIDWRTDGFEAWLQQHDASGPSILDGKLPEK